MASGCSYCGAGLPASRPNSKHCDSCDRVMAVVGAAMMVDVIKMARARGIAPLALVHSQWAAGFAEDCRRADEVDTRGGSFLPGSGWINGPAVSVGPTPSQSGREWVARIKAQLRPVGDVETQNSLPVTEEAAM